MLHFLLAPTPWRRQSLAAGWQFCCRCVRCGSGDAAEAPLLVVVDDQEIGGFHKWGIPKIDGLYIFILEDPTKMDDLGVPPFWETSK